MLSIKKIEPKVTTNKPSLSDFSLFPLEPSHPKREYLFDPFPADNAARVKYSMAYISILLAEEQYNGCSYMSVTIRENSDSNALETKYLWTAAMVFAQQMPKELKTSNIKIISTYFNPRKEKGLFSTFSSTSLYETVFKHYLTEDMITISSFSLLYDDLDYNAAYNKQYPFADFEGCYSGTVQEQQNLKKRSLIDEFEHKERIEEETRTRIQADKERQEESRYREALRQEEIRQQKQAELEKLQEMKRLEEAKAQEEARLLEAKRQDELRLAEKARIEEERQQKVRKELSENSSSNFKNTTIDEQKSCKDSAMIKKKSLHLISAIKDTSTHLSLIEVATLIKEGAAVNYQDEEGRTALMHAVSMQRDTIADYLFFTCKASAAIADTSGLVVRDLLSKQSLLYKAIKKSDYFPLNPHLDPIHYTTLLYKEAKKLQARFMVMKDLIIHGADIDALHPLTDLTPLMMAVEQQNDRVAEFLLTQGANPLVTNHHGYIARNFAGQHSSLFSLLSQKEKEQRLKSLSPTKRNSTLLLEHINSVNPSLTKLEEYIELGADINYQGYNGHTGLMLAMLANHEAVVCYLLNKGANIFLKNTQGKTAAQLVPKNSLFHTLITKRERQIALDALPPKERYGEMLVEYATKTNIRLQKIDRYFLLGANVNYQTHQGFTALMKAVDGQNDRLVEYLLRHGANPLLQNEQGDTARLLASRFTPIAGVLKGYELLWATREGNRSMINDLLKDDIALIEFKDHKGYTPLLIAVEQGFEIIVDDLIVQGASPSTTLNDGRGIFDLTTDENIRELLQQSSVFCSEGLENDTSSKVMLKKTSNFFASSLTSIAKQLITPQAQQPHDQSIEIKGP